jgi:tetratricopeptide (TPR) repeat protein
LWLDRLEADHENMRAAFEWSLQSDENEIGLRLVGDLPDYWVEQGYYQEGKNWIERALALIDQVPVQVQARVYCAAGCLYYLLKQLSQSRKMYDKALPLFRQLDDRISIGFTYIAMAGTAAGNPDDDLFFREHIEQALEYMQELDHKPGIHAVITDQGIHEAIIGRYPQAREKYEQAIILARELGQKIRESVNLINLGALILRERDDPLVAFEKMKQSLGLLREIGYKSPYLKGGPVSYCACVAVELGKTEDAVYAKSPISP